MTQFSLDELATVIARRAASTAEKSYTKSLLDEGPARAAQKFGEEAVELAIACAAGSGRDVVCESADVVYHLLVLLQSRQIAFQQVLDELAARTGKSGHAEKAARGTAPASGSERDSARK